MRTAALLVTIVVAASCGMWGDSEPDEATVRGLEATRRACIANQLSQKSAEDLQTLQQSTGQVGSEVGAKLPQSAATAALSFARAYDQHARLRTAAYAQVDSALNHSATPADSARHADVAARFQIALPEPGSVEANVISNYEQRFGAIYDDPRHPCNWLGQGESEKFGS